MLLDEIFADDYNACEVVYVTEDGVELIDESAIRAFKLDNKTSKVLKKFRCLGGPKAGRLVSSPGACGVRKDPSKVRRGRSVMRQKGGVIRRKSAITKKKSKNIAIANLNNRIANPQKK